MWKSCLRIYVFSKTKYEKIRLIKDHREAAKVAMLERKIYFLQRNLFLVEFFEVNSGFMILP